MNELIIRLQRLGLEQYVDAFIGEGFDSWETLLDIQESDLESLNVKLGHRRKLQRAIAEYRGISYDRLLGSPAQETPLDPPRHTEPAHVQGLSREAVAAGPVEAKRKYRRHPKADDNAPEKPPSAYVLFSNKIREEVKAENLSFTEIAKLVGDRWQKLDPVQKEPFESQASTLKESYNIQLSAYKKTDDFKEYSQYLADFRAKHGQIAESKRPKLDPQSSTGSASAASQQDVSETIPATQTHMRVGSIGSMSNASFTTSLTLPASASLSSMASLGNPTGAVNRSLSTMPRPGSPPISHFPRERRLIGQLSAQSSTSDESGPARPELYDPLPRAGTLSLNTPPTGTPPLPSYGIGSARSEHSASSESFVWPSRPSAMTAQQQQHGTAHSPHSANLNLPSPTVLGEGWRDRTFEAPRLSQNPPTLSQGFSSSLSFPPILGADRTPEAMRAQVQRTLPPLRQLPPTGQSTTSFSTGFPSVQIAHHVGGSGGIGQAQTEAGPRATTESEAANTLAGLANRPGPSPHQSPGKRRQK